jgi:hypothetical protein
LVIFSHIHGSFIVFFTSCLLMMRFILHKNILLATLFSLKKEPSAIKNLTLCAGFANVKHTYGRKTS